MMTIVAHSNVNRQVQEPEGDWPRAVIINADDLGMCEGINAAVGRAHREGVLTSASLLANGDAFEHALAHVVRPNPELGIGIHLCLTSGRSVSLPEQIPDLVDGRGCFRWEFVSLLRELRSHRSRLRPQIQTELAAQFARVRAAGVVIDHVDGHRHIHAIPAIHELIVPLAREYGCGAVRRPAERLWPFFRSCDFPRLVWGAANLPKQVVLRRLSRGHVRGESSLRSTDDFRGVLDSGRITVSSLKRILEHLPAGVTEVVTHPAMAGSLADGCWRPADRRFVSSCRRQVEFEALVAPAIQEACGRLGIRRVSFGHLNAVA